MVQMLSTLQNLSLEFTFSEAIILIKPLLLFIFGMALYSIFIFKFYRFVARRDIFKVNFEKYEKAKLKKTRKTIHSVFYMIKHALFYPLLLFFWFVVLSVILSFLSKPEDMSSVLLVTFALLSVIRMVSYYSEDLSKDLSKMLPFALLGVFLVDIRFFSITDSINALSTLPTLWKEIIYYMIFLILLEFMLRILYAFLSLFIKDKKKDKEEEKDEKHNL